MDSFAAKIIKSENEYRGNQKRPDASPDEIAGILQRKKTVAMQGGGIGRENRQHQRNNARHPREDHVAGGPQRLRSRLAKCPAADWRLTRRPGWKPQLPRAVPPHTMGNP